MTIKFWLARGLWRQRIDLSPINRSMRKEGFPAILTRGRTSHERKRYSEEQIISILNEREAGASAADLARMRGVAEQSIHRWKSKYGGMTVPDLKRLEGENLRLKRMVVDLSLDMRMLEDVIETSKKW